jgi:phosphoglycolate phosphatase
MSGRIKKTTVFLDLDGTLVDSQEAILCSFSKAWRDVSDEEVFVADVKVGPPVEEMFIAAGGNEDAAHEFNAAFRKHYDSVDCKTSIPYPDVAATMATMKKIGISLYCVTFKPMAPATTVLDATGLGLHLDGVVAIDSTSPPHESKAAMMAGVMAANGLSVGECLFVGDSQSDYDGAAECGMDFVFAAYGYGDVGCDDRIGSFDGVLQFI